MKELVKQNPSKDPNLAGYFWENEVFCRTSQGIRQSPPSYLNWQTAIADVISRQDMFKWNPTKPRTIMGQEIFECVQSYLPQDMAVRLHLYCSIGTALDYYHGVDAFFLIDKFVVTIDLTSGDFKRLRGKVKADFLLEKKKANIRLWRVCKEIADKFIHEL